MQTKILWQSGAALTLALLLVACKKEPPCDCNCNGSDSTVATVKVFATGLNNPRGLKFGPDGYLYVAEGGAGGTNSTVNSCTQVAFPVGPYLGSPTGGRVSKISTAGVRTTVLDNLPSSKANEIVGGDVEGVADVVFVDNTLYALLAGAGCSHGVPSVPNGIVRVNGPGSWTMIANISEWVMSHPVKNPEPGDFEPDGTPYSMIYVGGNFYVIEPNHGDMMKITTAGAITRVVDISASQGHIVPTAMAYRDNFYVGNLHPFPIVDGSSNIYKITPAGQVDIWATGLTTVLGVAFDKAGRLYVLENTTGAPGPTPGMGKIVRINQSGSKQIVASGLSVPTGMTMGDDGNLYVSNNGFGPTAVGGGEILQIAITDCNKGNVKY